MTEISLPYDQVCEIIAEEAAQEAKWQYGYRDAYAPMEIGRALVKFGHKLWRALEEAHLARQGIKRDRPTDYGDGSWLDHRYGDR